MAIKYFETQMQYRRHILKSRIETILNGTLAFNLRSWEKDYKEDMRIRVEKGEDKCTPK